MSEMRSHSLYSRPMRCSSARTVMFAGSRLNARSSALSARPTSCCPRSQISAIFSKYPCRVFWSSAGSDSYACASSSHGVSNVTPKPGPRRAPRRFFGRRLDLVEDLLVTDLFDRLRRLVLDDVGQIHVLTVVRRGLCLAFSVGG